MIAVVHALVVAVNPGWNHPLQAHRANEFRTLTQAAHQVATNLPGQRIAQGELKIMFDRSIHLARRSQTINEVGYFQLYHDLLAQAGGNKLFKNENHEFTVARPLVCATRRAPLAMHHWPCATRRAPPHFKACV